MSFKITQERPKPKLWLAKPNKQIIQRLNGIENLSGKFNFMNENELTFNINSYVFDEKTQEQKKNPALSKIRNKYLLKFTYNGQEEWFIIDSKTDTAEEKDYVPITARYIGSELDQKQVGTVEEIGKTIRDMMNQFLPVVAKNWSVRYIDDKLASVKREYNLTDASIGSILAEISEQTDAVIVFHNKDRQLSFVHKDNAGKFRGLKVKETTYLKSFTDAQNSQDLVTRLILEGKEGLSINSINPAGTSYIDDFSYYLKPFRRDSRRNVIEHSDYMSDNLAHALLDFNEYFENRQGDYEELSETYTKLLNEQLEEDFKLSEITATLNNLEERIEVLQPIDGYAEKTVRGNTSFNVDYNMHYMMLIYNNGSLARVTFEDEEHLIMPNEYKYIKIKTPKQVDVNDELLTYPLNVLASNPNLVVGLSNSSEADFEEDDIDELDKKYNVYKYRQLYAEQYAIVATIEKRVEAYNKQRQNINESLSAQNFFTPQLQEELENFTHWGVWREENHTDPKELLEDGREQLSERNNIDRTTTVNIIDFVQSLDPEDQKNWDKLVAGDKIRFSSETYEADLEAFISELNINFDDNDVSLTLSDVIDLRDKARGASQVLASFVSTSNQVNMQKKQLDENAGKTNQVMALLEAEWDANKRRILAGNETVDIGSHGIRITSPTHPNEMLVAVAGVISISDDYGETFKQAINTRGVVAERLIGKVILGTELIMENNSGTFRFDDDGVRINADHFHLIADDGEDYFDNLMRQLEQEFVSYEERIKADMEQQEESFKNEMGDVAEGISEYTNNLLDALADGMLTEQEINMLKMQMNMLEADYAQARRRIIPIVQSTDVDPNLQNQLYLLYMEFEEDYEKLLSFIRNLDDPIEVNQETIDGAKDFLVNFKPNIEEIISLAEMNLEAIQSNRIANAEYNSRTFTENLVHDLEDEIGDLNEALEGFDLGFEGAIADGVLDMIERANISDALLRVESEKANVDNRYAFLSVHKYIVNTDQLRKLQNAKQEYNAAFNTLINRINYILAREKITSEMVSDYREDMQGFSNQIVNYSQVYEESLEYVQNRYADTQRGEAEKYADGLKLEVDSDIADVHDNISNFAEDVYGAFADGIITERERARLQIHHDMLEKEKSDVIERYNTIITSQYLQGFYDTEKLVQERARYGEIHADLLLNLELAMMDDKITKEEADQAVANFEEYVERLTSFSVELELAIAALGESKAVYQTKEELKNYIELSVFNDEIAQMQSTLDGHIMTWYYDHEPTLNNEPAVNWTDSATKERHVGDLFYYGEEGFAYRFMKKPGGGFKWSVIKDNDITKALADAQDAIDLADSKRRVFVATPTAPYDIGDLWIMDDGELMRARKARAEGEVFLEGDWILATKYTDDTKANAVENMLNDFQGAVNDEFEDLVGTFDAFKKTIEGAFKDGIIEEYELKILQTQAQSLDREKADVDALYNQLLNRSELTSGERNTLVTRYNSFSSTHQTLVSGIRLAIEDGVISEEEYEATMRALDDYPEAVSSIKDYMNQLITDLINRVAKDAKDALEGVDRFDTWKSSSFEVDTEKIATRVGESSWKTTWLPVVEQGINDASEATEALIAETNKELNDVKDSLSTFEDTITNSFKNGIIEEAEAKAIKSHKAQLSKEKKDIDQKYTTIYANSRLSGTAKTNLLSAKTAFNTSHSSLISAIDKAIADGKATTTEYNTVISGFGDYEAKLATLTYRFEEANDYIGSTKASEAELAAKKYAEDEFKKTNKEIKDINDALESFEGDVTGFIKDGIIEEAEAKAIRVHLQQIDKEKDDIDKKYSEIYGNSRLTGSAKTNLLNAKTSFNSAHSNLKSYINSAILDDKVTSSEASTIDSRFSSYSSALSTLSQRLEQAVNAIASKYASDAESSAKSHADNKAQAAQDAAEAYAKTKAEAERVLAEAHADGIVTAEEEARIADVNARLEEAKAHADTTSKEAEDAAKGYADTEISKIEKDIENQFKTVNSNAYGLNEDLTKAFKDGIISEAEATAIGDSINLVKSDYENVMKRYTNVYANSGLTGTAKTRLLSARNAYNTSYNALINHITTVISSGEITDTQRTTYNTRFSDYRVKIGVLSDAIESAWDAITNKKSDDAINAAKKHADNLKKEIDGELADVVEALGDFEGDVTGFIKDGIIEEAEAKAIKTHLQQIDKEKADVDKVYAELYGNDLLLGTAKTNLLDAKKAYNTAHSNLKSYITTAISNDKVTSTEATNIESRFSTYSTALATLSQRIEQSSDSIAERHAANAVDAVSIGGVNLANWTDTTEKNKENTPLTGRADELSLVTLQGERFFQVRVIEALDSENSLGVYVGRRYATEGYNSYFDIEQGQEYTLTLRGAHSSTVDPFSYVFIMRDDNLENPDSSSSGANQGVSRALVDRVNVETGYGSRYKFTFTANWSSRKAYLLIGTKKKAGYSNSTSYWFRFKEVQLEKGNKATDYKLSQKDQDENISGAIDNFYNTEVKAKYSTTEQTNELLAGYVTDADYKGNLDKIASYSNSVQLSGTEYHTLREANGNQFDDAFSYEISARTQELPDSLYVGVLNSKGAGNGWEIEDLEKKGTTGRHPRVTLFGSRPIVWGHNSASGTFNIDYVYTKYAGSFTNITKTQSMIEQRADEIEMGVSKKIDTPSRNLIPHSTLPEENDMWSTFSSLTSITSARDYMWIYDYTGGSNNNFAVQSSILPTEIYEGQEYTLSFKAARINNVYDDMRYCYLLNENGDNYYISTSKIKRKSLGKDYRGLDLYYYTATFEPNFSGKARVLIGTRTITTANSRLYIKEPQLEVGAVATPYDPAPTDLLEASARLKVTADNISSEVKKKIGDDEVISKINQSAEKISINANKINLTAGSPIDEAIQNNSHPNPNMVPMSNFWNYPNELFYENHSLSVVNNSESGLFTTPEFGRGWVKLMNSTLSTPSGLTYMWTQNGGRNRFRLAANQEYTFSILVAQNSDMYMNYCYIREVTGGTSQINLATSSSVKRRRMEVGRTYGRTVYKYIFTFTPSFGGSNAYMFFGLSDRNESRKGYYLSEWKLEAGDQASPYVEDYASKDYIIAAINMDKSGTRISGDKVSVTAEDIALDGKTIDIGSNSAITSLKQQVGSVEGVATAAEGAAETAREEASTADSRARAARNQADAARNGNNVVRSINNSGTTVNISASKINLSGYATFSSLSTAGSSTIHGDNITTGRLTSSNGRTTFNLNTGKLTMSNADFELGGGATIQFTNSGNRIVYARKDPQSSWTRYAGIGVGTNINSRFPYAYLGTTAGGSGALDASDDQNFTGFITNTNGRMNVDDIGNSVVGSIFHIRDESVSFSKGFAFNLKSNTISMYGMNTSSYNYNLGSSINMFRRIYVRSLYSNDGLITLSNASSSYTNQGIGMETVYGNDSNLHLRKLATDEYVSLGKPYRRFSYVYLNYQPNVSSDARLKERIHHNKLGLDFINDIETKSFYLINNNPHLDKEPKQFGIVAQQLNTTLEKHGEDPQESNIVTKGEDGMYGVQYTQLISPTIKAIQDLNKKVNEENEALKEENELLKNRLDKIEEMLLK